MPKYRVALSKVVHELLKATVVVEAPDPDRAMLVAIDTAQTIGNDVEWDYDVSLEESGEITATRAEEAHAND